MINLGKRKKKLDIFPGYKKVRLPDRAKLSNLINACKGNRTISSFATDCGFSSPSILRAIKDFDSPISEELMQEMYNHADPNIDFTLQEFLDAYGMVPVESINTEDFKPNELKITEKTTNNISYAKEIENISRLVLQDALLSKNFSIFRVQRDARINHTTFDLIIDTNTFEEDEIKKWCIEIKATSFAEDKLLEKMFSSLYLRTEKDEKYKVSLALIDNRVFDTLCEKYKNIEVIDDISFILIDRINYKLNKEFILRKKGEERRKKSLLEN